MMFVRKCIKLEVVARIVLQTVEGSYAIVEKYPVVPHIIGGLLKRRENNMRWVTFYDDVMIMNGRLTDVVIHKDKESATKYFKTHYKDYFQLNHKHIEVKLPMRYGFPFHSFYGISLLKFKHIMMERFKIDEKEFNKQLKELECGQNEVLL